MPVFCLSRLLCFVVLTSLPYFYRESWMFLHLLLEDWNSHLPGISVLAEMGGSFLNEAPCSASDPGEGQWCSPNSIGYIWTDKPEDFTWLFHPYRILGCCSHPGKTYPSFMGLGFVSWGAFVKVDLLKLILHLWSWEHHRVSTGFPSVLNASHPPISASWICILPYFSLVWRSSFQFLFTLR